MTLEIFEADHIMKDTAKYASKLTNMEVYQDTVIRLGYILEQHENKMPIKDIYTLKLAQATVCQLGLQKELEYREEILKKMGGEDGI